MKNKYFLFSLIVIICCFNFVKVSGKSKLLLEKTIFLDPGHGGVDPGATYKDIKESNINLSICLKLKEKLEKEGAVVYLTRYGDYDLSAIGARRRKKSDFDNRIKLINDSKADMYISIHLNAINSSTWSGAQIFYDDVNKQNKVIAESFSNYLKFERKISELKDMYLNKNIKIPGVLIEVGFLSNYQDRIKLTSDEYQNKFANQIVKAIINYYNN